MELADESSLGWMQQLRRWILTSSAGRSLHFLGVLFSLLSCALYVAESYPKTVDSVPFVVWLALELAIAGIFVAFLVLDLMLSRKPFEFIVSPHVLLDAVSVLPVFKLLAWEQRSLLLRAFAGLRALRVLKLEGLS